MGQNGDSKFWAQTSTDPKRSYRWVLTLSNIDSFFIKTTNKPGYTIQNVPHQFVANTFNFPGRLTWEPISITLVDPIQPDATMRIIKILQASGYAIPTTPEDGKRSFSKLEASKALGSPSIKQLNAQGQTVEEWVLNRAWIESAKFGELSYETDAMVNITLSIRYDWAEYTGNPTIEEGLVTGMEQIMSAAQVQKDTIKNYQNDLGVTLGVGE